MVYSFLCGWFFVKNRYENCVVRLFMSAENGLLLWSAGNCRRGDRAMEKVSICACLLCAFPALQFAKCSLTVRQVQFRSPLAKIITTSKRKCARSCGVGDVVQGGGRCPKQYLLVLQGCISAHCANIQPHNLAFSVARSPTCAHSLHFGHCSLMSGSLPSRALGMTVFRRQHPVVHNFKVCFSADGAFILTI